MVKSSHLFVVISKPVKGTLPVETLVNICLICQSLLPRSRQILYEDVVFQMGVLYPEEPESGDAEEISESKKVSENTENNSLMVQAFFDTLQRWPYCVHLFWHQFFGKAEYSRPMRYCRCQSSESIVNARDPDLLPNLSSLAVEVIPPLHHSLLALRRPLPRLKIFLINQLCFSSISDLQWLFIGLSPNIENLVLNSVEFLAPQRQFVIFPQKYTTSGPSLVELFGPDEFKIVM
ncbi:hypothetical protein ABKN59_010255 [Abortiporus biennis]